MNYYLINIFIFSICTLSFNVHSAMHFSFVSATHNIPKIATEFVKDRNMRHFKVYSGEFLVYPLLFDNTKYSLIDFHKKYESFLDSNITQLRSAMEIQTTINEYTAVVKQNFLTNVRWVTSKAMQENLPFIEVSTDENLKKLRSANNIGFYCYPRPSENNFLDAALFIHQFESTLKLNRHIAKERDVSEGQLNAYEEKVLGELDILYLTHFKNHSRILPIIKSNATTTCPIVPFFIIVQSNDELAAFIQKIDVHLFFPLPNEQAMINRYRYQSAYCVMLRKNIAQLQQQGLTLSELLFYERTMLNYLKEIISRYDKQLAFF